MLGATTRVDSSLSHPFCSSLRRVKLPGETFMNDQKISAAVDRTERSGSPGLVLLFAGFLVAAAVAFSLRPRNEAANLVVGLLALLAVVGIFALFAYAV